MSTKSSMLLGVYSIGFDIGNFSLTITAGYDEVKSYEATFFNVLPTCLALACVKPPIYVRLNCK